MRWAVAIGAIALRYAVTVDICSLHCALSLLLK